MNGRGGRREEGETGEEGMQLHYTKDDRMACCVYVNFRKLIVELVSEEEQVKMMIQTPL